VLQQLTQLGRTDSAVGAPIDLTTVQKYDFFAQCSVYVFYVYGEEGTGPVMINKQTNKVGLIDLICKQDLLN